MIRRSDLFFFNDTATTEIYTLSLHDALPILVAGYLVYDRVQQVGPRITIRFKDGRDRKSTRLNSSHSQISYAVFCLKKKKKKDAHPRHPDEPSELAVEHVVDEPNVGAANLGH